MEIGTSSVVYVRTQIQQQQQFHSILTIQYFEQIYIHHINTNSQYCY